MRGRPQPAATEPAMRQQGRLTGWKDEQGFGFIEPDGGGAQVFVHIKSFTDRRRRPEGGERVSYVPSRNAQGKWRAQDVAFIDEPRTGRPQPARRSRAGMPSRPQSPVRGQVAVGLAAAFFCVLLAVAWSGRMPWTLVGLYAAASFVTFMVYGFDKSAARHDRWRTSESRLHLRHCCAAGPARCSRKGCCGTSPARLHSNWCSGSPWCSTAACWHGCCHRQVRRCGRWRPASSEN